MEHTNNLIINNINGFNDLVYMDDNNNVIETNTIIFKLCGKVINEPTRISIQIGKDMHIEDPYGQYMNHSCNPTCYIKDGAVYSLQNITKNTSLTFDYNENEDCMSTPFKCNCCQQIIAGKNKKIDVPII